MNAHLFQLQLLTHREGRREYADQGSAAVPVLMTDAMLLRRALQAGVDPAEYAPILAARVPRESGWSHEEALSLARAALAPKPAANKGRAEAACTAVFNTRPRRYQFTVGSETMMVTAASLTSRKQFVQACIDQVSKIPQLPSQKEWDDWLSGQIESAPVVEEPEEASDEGAQKSNIEETLRHMGRGETYEDLMSGSWVEHNGKKIVHMVVLQRQAKTFDQTLRPYDVARSLRELGWVATVAWLGDPPKSVRVWESPDVVEAEKPRDERIRNSGAELRLLRTERDHSLFATGTDND